MVQIIKCIYCFDCRPSQELELPMLKVSAPELVSGVSGESEQKLRELFDQAVVSVFFYLHPVCHHADNMV